MRRGNRINKSLNKSTSCHNFRPLGLQFLNIHWISKELVEREVIFMSILAINHCNIKICTKTLGSKHSRETTTDYNYFLLVSISIHSLFIKFARFSNKNLTINKQVHYLLTNFNLVDCKFRFEPFNCI